MSDNSSLTLYQISDELSRLLEIEDSTEETEALISYFSGQLEKKAEGIGNVIAYCVDRAERLKDRADQFAKQAKAFESKAARIREYLKSNMNSAGIANIKTDSWRFVLAPTAGSVVVDDESAIPARFKEIVQTVRIDKAAIKAAMKTETIPGAHIEPGLSLRIT